MPTILAAALMVFMQAFADFGTPMLLGEGFQTFPVLIYNEYLGEGGQNFNFAAALAWHRNPGDGHCVLLPEVGHQPVQVFHERPAPR